jgi:hypothetical protein
MPLNKPYLGHPLFVISPVYQYDYTETVNSDVQVNSFQSGFSARNAFSSRKQRMFNLVFKTVTIGLMNDLERFYRDLGGQLSPFWFKPPIELFSSRYTQLLSDGSQKLEDFESVQLRAGDQSVLVRFTQPFNRTLFKPLLENTGLILEEVFGEDDPGKYIHFDGLLESQNAVIQDHAQDYLDLGSKDFMIDFLFRAETIFTSSSASYAAMSGKTLIFTIDGTPYTVTFTAAAVDATTTAQEINDQHGDKVECQVFGTTELKIRTLIDSGYFTISGTAFAQLTLAAPVVYPIHKHDGVDTGYYIKQDGIGNLIFFMESGGTGATITADASFHLFDGVWHYIAIVIDESGNGQFYVDAATSGSAVSVSAVGSLDNTADFYLHKDANADIQMDRVGIWSWDSGSLPTTIATIISNLYDSWNQRHSLDVSDEDGLQVLYAFDDETGDDSVQQENLTLNNDPSFFDFDQ